jgi:hypothetical protein
VRTGGRTFLALLLVALGCGAPPPARDERAPTTPTALLAPCLSTLASPVVEEAPGVLRWPAKLAPLHRSRHGNRALVALAPSGEGLGLVGRWSEPGRAFPGMPCPPEDVASDRRPYDVRFASWDRVCAGRDPIDDTTLVRAPASDPRCLGATRRRDAPSSPGGPCVGARDALGCLDTGHGKVAFWADRLEAVATKGARRASLRAPEGHEIVDVDVVDGLWLVALTVRGAGIDGELGRAVDEDRVVVLRPPW